MSTTALMTALLENSKIREIVFEGSPLNILPGETVKIHRTADRTMWIRAAGITPCTAGYSNVNLETITVDDVELVGGTRHCALSGQVVTWTVKNHGTEPILVTPFTKVDVIDLDNAGLQAAIEGTSTTETGPTTAGTEEASDTSTDTAEAPSDRDDDGDGETPTGVQGFASRPRRKFRRLTPEDFQALAHLLSPSILGLGSVRIRSEDGASLTEVANRNFYPEDIEVWSDNPGVLVTGIYVAGMPMQVGALGIPVSAFPWDVAGSRMIQVGQQVRITFHNPTDNAARVSAGIKGAEMQMGVAQQAMEMTLLQAALDLVRPIR